MPSWMGGFQIGDLFTEALQESTVRFQHMIVDVSDLSRQKSNRKVTTKSQVYFPRLLVLIFCERFRTAGAPRSPPTSTPQHALLASVTITRMLMLDFGISLQ